MVVVRCGLVQRRLLELVARIHVGDVRKQDLRDVTLTEISSPIYYTNLNYIIVLLFEPLQNNC